MERTLRQRIPFAILGLVCAASLSNARQEVQPDIDRSPVQRERPVGQTSGATTPETGGSGPGVLPGSTRLGATFPLEYRSIDGSGNNPIHLTWGAADTPFRRLLAPDYADGAQAPSGMDRPSAREVSNAVVAQDASIPNQAHASDYLWQWGQFLDHDVTETPVAEPEEPFDIHVPLGDAWFDPGATGMATIPLSRSSYDVVQGVREQVNLITAYIDASNVYGSDLERAHGLRTLDGTGRLKTSAGDLLPYNHQGLPNAPTNDAKYFVGGDIRANEQVALTAMHTLFVREHNYWAERMSVMGLDGETIYQVARAIVGAEMQAITYREFLPVLLGPNALKPYHGYDDQVDASLVNEFATAAYRVGHTMLSPELLRLNADGSTLAAGHLPLQDGFFQPRQIVAHGIEPYLRGLARQAAQEIDPYVIDAVRNFLFGPPGAGGFDLAALNIQRGRDHGLPTYNALRAALLGQPVQDFGQISSKPEIRARLESVYADVDDVDAWVGLLSEDHAPGALVGPTLRAILANQFERLRDGDRFFYLHYLDPALVHFVEQQTLAVIIRRNTTIGAELQDDVFRVVP